MTTKSDWEFRAHYLRDAASALDAKAAALMAEANRYRSLAHRADINASQHSATQVAEVA